MVFVQPKGYAERVLKPLSGSKTFCKYDSTYFIFNKMEERGIRTLGVLLECASCRVMVARSARTATCAVAPCTLLHAGGAGDLPQVAAIEDAFPLNRVYERPSENRSTASSRKPTSLRTPSRTCARSLSVPTA